MESAMQTITSDQLQKGYSYIEIKQSLQKQQGRPLTEEEKTFISSAKRNTDEREAKCRGFVAVLAPHTALARAQAQREEAAETKRNAQREAETRARRKAEREGIAAAAAAALSRALASEAEEKVKRHAHEQALKDAEEASAREAKEQKRLAAKQAIDMAIAAARAQRETEMRAQTNARGVAIAAARAQRETEMLAQTNATAAAVVSGALAAAVALVATGESPRYYQEKSITAVHEKKAEKEEKEQSYPKQWWLEDKDAASDQSRTSSVGSDIWCSTDVCTPRLTSAGAGASAIEVAKVVVEEEPDLPDVSFESLSSQLAAMTTAIEQCGQPASEQAADAETGTDTDASQKADRGPSDCSIDSEITDEDSFAMQLIIKNLDTGELSMILDQAHDSPSSVSACIGTISTPLKCKRRWGKFSWGGKTRIVAQ